VLSLIGVIYTGADRVRALSAYGTVMGLAAVGGQLIGGVLVQANLAGAGWRSCFLINVPVGLAAPGLPPARRTTAPPPEPAPAGATAAQRPDVVARSNPSGTYAQPPPRVTGCRPS
jgi:MFS family permease